MKKIFMFLATVSFMGLLSASSASAQNNYVPTEDNLKAREAFEDMRFGIFIHWGIYSMFAQGEWYLNNGLNAGRFACNANNAPSNSNWNYSASLS